MPVKIPDSSKKLLQFIQEQITIAESPEEINSIAHYLLEHFFEIDRTEILLDRSVNISSSQHKELNRFIERLNSNEPIQYIIGEADFYGRKFIVNPHVLIPRSETEELVHLIVNDYKGKRIKFVDIGAGSGCIPVTIAKELKDAKGYAIDFDPRVIKVAKQNAQRHDVQLEFLLVDILREPIPIQSLDIVVSNPPYVTQQDKLAMKPNVLNHEPDTALYVEDADPLIFYKRIANLAKGSLKPDGHLYYEVNEAYAAEVANILKAGGYKEVLVIRDMQKKGRIVRGRLPGDLLS